MTKHFDPWTLIFAGGLFVMFVIAALIVLRRGR